jgi:hypothetical protein
MIYEILDDTGMVINTIVADYEFVETNYSGHYRLVPPTPPPPPLPTWVITKVAMISRFTPQEYVGIVGATKTDVEVQAWYDLFQAASKVNLQDQRTIAGINALVPKDLITQDRADTILTTSAHPNEMA